MFVSITIDLIRRSLFILFRGTTTTKGMRGVSERTVELIRSVMAVYAVSNVPYRI